MDHTTRITFDPAERRIVGFSSAAHFFTHFFMLVFPALVVPIGTTFDLSVPETLVIGFWMYLLYGVLAVGWGYISDRFGHRWAMGIGMTVAGVGLAAAGLAPNRGWLMTCFAIVGTGCSAYHPSGTALASQGVRARGRALGVIGIWGNAGIASVPFVVGVLAYLLGWRTSLEVLGALGAATGVLGLLLPFSVSRGTDLAAKESDDTASTRRLFLILCIGLVFGGLMYRGFTVELPAFLEHQIGHWMQGVRGAVAAVVPSRATISVDTLTADVVASVIYVIGMVGQVAGGRIADRASLKWSYFLFFCAALPFIAATAALGTPVIVAAAGLFVFFSLGMQPIENSLIATLTPARWRSVGYGIKFTLNFGAGSFAVWLMSFTGTRFGVEHTMWVVAAFLVLVIANTAVFLVAARGRDLRQGVSRRLARTPGGLIR